MARDLKTIYNQIITEKETFSGLQDLAPLGENYDSLLQDVNSRSKVAVWRLICWIVAYAIWLFEKMQDLFKADLQQLIEATRFGTLPWYQEKAMDFQYGDDLSYVNYHFVYDPLDTSKQIIKRAAATVATGQISLKVAKLDGNDPVKLETDELTAFQAYVSQIKPPGERLVVISLDPDLMKLEMEVIYDPQVMKSDGSLISDPTVKPVEDAINDYLAGIVWDGKFNIRKWVDAVQLAQGVIDPRPGNAYGKASDASAYTSIANDYYSTSGYMVVDPANPLSSTITYTSNV
jgi:hypothetical protein